MDLFPVTATRKNTELLYWNLKGSCKIRILPSFSHSHLSFRWLSSAELKRWYFEECFSVIFSLEYQTRVRKIYLMDLSSLLVCVNLYINWSKLMGSYCMHGGNMQMLSHIKSLKPYWMCILKQKFTFYQCTNCLHPTENFCPHKDGSTRNVSPGRDIFYLFWSPWGKQLNHIRLCFFLKTKKCRKFPV